MSRRVYQVTEGATARFCYRLHLDTVILVNFKVFYHVLKDITWNIDIPFWLLTTSVKPLNDVMSDVCVDLIPWHFPPGHSNACGTFRLGTDIWRCFCWNYRKIPSFNNLLSTLETRSDEFAKTSFWAGYKISHQTDLEWTLFVGFSRAQIIILQ